MASKNETVHFVAEEMREPVFRYGEVDSVVSLRMRDYADRIEAAHRREMDTRALMAGASLAESVDEEHKREVAELQGERNGILKANESLAADNTRLRGEVAELRECIREALDVACDGCNLAVWNAGKFVKCKKHKNWKCPLGTERWRKALEGANDECK